MQSIFRSVDWGLKESGCGLVFELVTSNNVLCKIIPLSIASIRRSSRKQGRLKQVLLLYRRLPSTAPACNTITSPLPIFRPPLCPRRTKEAFLALPPASQARRLMRLIYLPEIASYFPLSTRNLEYTFNGMLLQNKQASQSTHTSLIGSFVLYPLG